PLPASERRRHGALRAPRDRAPAQRRARDDPDRIRTRGGSRDRELAAVRSSLLADPGGAGRAASAARGAAPEVRDYRAFQPPSMERPAARTWSAPGLQR